MRKDVREGVRKFMNEGIKPNFAALARQYDCDYRTVKAAYESETQNTKEKERVKRRSKLDAFKPIIHDKLEIQCSVIISHDKAHLFMRSGPLIFN